MGAKNKGKKSERETNHEGLLIIGNKVAGSEAGRRRGNWITGFKEGS